MLPLVVEVRDRTLARVGILTDEDLTNLQLFPTANGVGTWSIELPHEVRDDSGAWVRHHAAQELAQPGAGIVVELPGGRRFSGPVLNPAFTETSDAPRGKWTFTGVSDAIVLSDRVAFPNPAIADAQASSKSRAYDIRSGRAETLMHAYVDANIGTLAPSGRRDVRLAKGVDLGRGSVQPKSVRFTNLLELLQELATADGLLFDVVQIGDTLELVTSVPTDRAAEVRLDVQGDSLDSASFAYSSPRVTRAIVLGQGEADKRLIRTRTTAKAEELAADWGRVIESVIDQRNAELPEELDAAGDDALAEGGSEVVSLDVVPSAVNANELGTAWWLGDRVTVNVADQPVEAVVTTIRITVTPDGLYAGATVGDAVGFDADRVTGARMGGVESRVSSLERNAEAASEVPATLVTSLLTSGMTPLELKYQRRAGWVSVRGRINRTGGQTGPAFVLPEGCRPDSTVYVVGSASGNNRAELLITAAGAVNVANNVTNGDFVFVCSFPAA